MGSVFQAVSNYCEVVNKYSWGKLHQSFLPVHFSYDFRQLCKWKMPKYIPTLFAKIQRIGNIYFVIGTKGQQNEFYLGVARVIRKMRFCEFSKYLLYKSTILVGPRPPCPDAPEYLFSMPQFVSVNQMLSSSLNGLTTASVTLFWKESLKYIDLVIFQA